MNAPAATLAERVNTITLSPPLVITRSEIDSVIAVLDKAIEEMGSQLGTS
jgi:4-aminobutyrate aminotransferase-like enzyme